MNEESKSRANKLCKTLENDLTESINKLKVFLSCIGEIIEDIESHAGYIDYISHEINKEGK